MTKYIDRYYLNGEMYGIKFVGGGWQGDMDSWTLAQTSSALTGNWWGGVFFNPDGTKIYLTHVVGSKVYESTLSTPYDLSTITFNKYITQTTEDIHFSPDGQYMFLLQNPYVNRYILSTPRDISTAVYSDQLYEGDNRGLFLSEDGTKVFVSYHGNTTIDLYNLSTARDLSTADGGSTATSSYGGLGIRFSPDGKRFFTQQNESTTDLTYLTLSTPYDFSTIIDSGTKNIGTCRAGGLWFNNVGTICVMVGGGYNTNYVTKYTL